MNIPMSCPDIDASDEQIVLEVIRSGRLALGKKNEEFEKAMADYIGTKHAVSVSSGTAALHLIMIALGIQEGDEVLVPSFTFAASVNCILYVKAKPIFVEIEPKTYTIDPEDLKAKITKKSKAIIVVDVFGHPILWREVLEIAQDHDLKIIDDSCEALGSEYQGEKIGKFGDAATFAFYPNKQITTGEGGVIVTDNDHIASFAKSLRNQGRGQMGSWLEHEHLGYNYRLDEMSAALGISQLKRIEEFISKREKVAQIYDEHLSTLPQIKMPIIRDNVKVSRFVYVVELPKSLSRDKVMVKMSEQGVPTRAYFSPIHEQTFIRQRFPNVSLPITESIANQTVALPFHNNLSQTQVAYVVETLKKSL